MLAAVLADNRRSAYRVRPIATDSLTIKLHYQGQEFSPYEVADVTGRGASMRFTKGTAPQAAKGEELELSIDTPNLRGQARISATVVFCGESTTERLFGLSFTAIDEFGRRSSEHFFQLFNRRGAYRDDILRPVYQAAAMVMPLEARDNSNLFFPVDVRNISATGICLDVDYEADRFMSGANKVRLALTLPGKHAPRDIITSLCYRSVIEGKIYYGGHYEWTETPQARLILEDLTEYTLERFDDPALSLS